MSARAIQRSGINLLPPEVISRRKVAQQRRMMFGAFGLFIVVLAGLWFVRNMALSHQEDRRAAAQAKVSVVNARVNALSEVAALDTTVKEKGALLANVMTKDIGWSRLMDEILGVIPTDSTLTGFSGAAEGFGAAQSTAATAPAAAGAAPVPGAGVPPAVPVAPVRYGTLNFTATGFSFPGVAQWIDRVSEVKSVQNIWVPQATKGTSGTSNQINYTSTADLTPVSGSGRFQQGVSK